MEYYSALKKILPCGTAWMTLEDAMLSEISQSQKDKSFFFLSNYTETLKHHFWNQEPWGPHRCSLTAR